MRRLDLCVPYADKNEARRLGARWDPVRRVWFVPEDCDGTPFARWLPATDPPNVRAASYFLATTTYECWRCRGPSRVHGFALPPGHETMYVDEETGEVSWEASDAASFVCYLEYVLPSAIVRQRSRAPHYRFGLRRRTQTHYWVNYCDHCGAKLGDYDVFCEPGQGFMPLTGEQAAHIALTRIAEPFQARAGGWSLGVDLFEFMTAA